MVHWGKCNVMAYKVTFFTRNLNNLVTILQINTSSGDALLHDREVCSQPPQIRVGLSSRYFPLCFT